MSELYENLLKATDNTSDITNEKYATVTKLQSDLFCSVKEDDTGLEHSNVPIVNGANLGLGDKVIIGFLNNSIYDVVCYGALDKTVHDTTKQDKLISGENIKTINNNSILGSGNLVIEGGGTGVDIVTEWETTTSDSKVASEKLTKDTLDTKVDKENGKGLSSNDFTNNYKSTMDSLKTVATTGSYTDLTNKPSIPSASSSNPSADTSSGAVGTGTTWARADHKHPKSSIYAESSHTHTKSQITDFPTLSTVATTGDYDDLLDKPNIPSKISDLTNDSDFIEKSNTTGLLKNDGTVDTTSYSTFSGSYNDLSNKPNIPTKISDLTNDSDFIEKSNTSGLVKNDGTIDTSNYLTSSALSNYVQKSSTNGLLKNDGTVDTTSYSTFSGSYSDLSNKPSIPSSSSDLSDGSDLVKKSSTSGLLKNDGSVDTNSYLTSSSLSNYVQKSSTAGLLKNDGTVDTSAYITSSAISGKEDTSNKVSSWSSTTNDTHYPTEKLVKDSLDSKQATLVSGTNIKTINNTSLLGSGNITVGGGGNVPTKTSDLTNDGADGTNVFVANNDSRLSDARTPTSHTHTSNQVTDLIDTIYPVGSIYMSVNSTSPQTLFGGTWVQIKDTFLLASGDTYSNGATGGSANAVVVSHTHTQNQHRHELTGSKTGGMSSGNYLRAGVGSATDGQYTNYSTPTINSTGEDGTGKNMPPYLAVNVWKRTA